MPIEVKIRGKLARDMGLLIYPKPIELGIGGNGSVLRNLTANQLVEIAIKNGEGVLSNTGALVVNTGKYTGRSPDDKYIVDSPAIHDDIAWGSVNRPIKKENFDSFKI